MVPDAFMVVQQWLAVVPEKSSVAREVGPVGLLVVWEMYSWVVVEEWSGRWRGFGCWISRV
ncbi:hypothetical protein GCM10022226_63710 [Sphaerisporangium flaviroseum]|uniref:Uncharacterized protein n=1 Tax=Sphaerisporangium flaviroseum TaxID=509199 RepID=A0ABP7J3Y6_9ACTN